MSNSGSNNGQYWSCGLDELVASPYLAGMARRLLLTLLALLTGLAAQGSPAQARGCVADRTEIGAYAQLSAAQEQRVSAVRARVSGPVSTRDDPECPAMAMLPETGRAPAVRIGADRARE